MMMAWVKRNSLLFLIVILSTAGSASADTMSYRTFWDPADVLVDESHPYYFAMELPGWDLEKEAYTAAYFNLTYRDQSYLDIFIFAADPAADAGVSGNYDMLLGSVPYRGYRASGIATFDLLTTLSKDEFDTLFMGQKLLYLVADCHYYFDKASLCLKGTAETPIPSALWLMASGIAGLIGLKKRMRQRRAMP